MISRSHQQRPRNPLNTQELPKLSPVPAVRPGTSIERRALFQARFGAGDDAVAISGVAKFVVLTVHRQHPGGGHGLVYELVGFGRQGDFGRRTFTVRRPIRFISSPRSAT